MKRDDTVRKRFNHLPTGSLEPMASSAGLETTLEIPWRDFLPPIEVRAKWWRFVVPVAGLLAVVLSLPSLQVDFFLDDYLMLGVIEGWYGVEAPAVNLYASFAEVFNAPWWSTPSEAGLNFWRPLTSAMIRLNHALFARDAVLYHVHFLLWLAALVAVCGRLYRRLSPPVAATALVVFAADEAHSYTSGTICNGHAVISVVPALLGLVAYLRWREGGWRPGLPLALLGFAVGLLGGETAFAVLAYPLAYEIFAGPGSRGRRLRAIAPVALLAVAYVLFYKAMGFGPGQSGFYLNPFEQPLPEFLKGLAIYVPLNIASLLAALPMQLVAANPALGLPYLLAGVALSAVLFAVWRRLRRRLAKNDRMAMSWLVTGAFAALLPMTFAPPSERQLLVPAIGIAPLVASIAVLAWKRWRRPTTPPRVRVAAAVGIALLAFLHLGVASWNRVAKLQAMTRINETLVEDATAVARIVEEKSGNLLMTGGTSPRHEVVLVTSDFFVTHYAPLIQDAYGRQPRSTSWSTLSMAPFEHRLTRSGPRTLILEPVGGQMSGATSLAAGDRVEAGIFTAEILATNEMGPTRVAFHFERDLDDPDLTLVAWDHARLAEIEPIAMGESVVLHRPPRISLP